MYFTFRGRLALLPPFARMPAAWRWVPSKCAQLGAHVSSQAPGVEFSRVISFLKRRYPGFAETAYQEFIAHVEPDFDELSYEHAERLHELALEWAIFDKPLEGGLSGIDLYCEENPDRRGNGYLSQLREEVNNQFSGMFSVEHVDIAAHRLELLDVYTGEMFWVRDYSLSEGLFREGEQGPCGVIVARLTKSGGAWFFPGNVVAFYPVVMADHMKEVLREEGGERPSSRCWCVRRTGLVRA